MTVKELMEVLKKCEQDAEVQVWSLLKHKFVPLDADDIMEYPNHKILYIDKN